MLLQLWRHFFISEKESNSEKLFEKYENRFNYLFTRFVNLLRLNMLIVVMSALLVTMYRYWTYDVMVAEDWQMALPVRWRILSTISWILIEFGIFLFVFQMAIRSGQLVRLFSYGGRS